jgi:hypothetical protein
VEKKEKLLQMAGNGEPKPTYKDKILYNTLRKYLDRRGNSYDPDFDSKLRKLRPDWF